MPAERAALFTSIELARAAGFLQGEKDLIQQLMLRRLKEREDSRAAARPFVLTIGDLWFLARLGTVQGLLGEHEASLATFALGRDLAASEDDLQGARLFCWYGVGPCISLLDLTAAEQVLCQALQVAAPLGLDNVPAVLSHLSNVLAELKEQAARDEHRSEALLALCSFAAATGRLGAACSYLQELLAHPERQHSPRISPRAELAVFLGELHLDRGELDQAELVRADWQQFGNVATQIRWQVLHANVLTMRLQLSDARQVLDVLLANPSLESVTRTVVLWLRAQLAYQTNALRDGERFLDELAALDSMPPHDLQQLRLLLSARRGGLLNLPPTTREIMDRRLERGSRKDPCSEVTVQRTSTRVAVDWARLHNHILLSLHCGRFSDANETLADLSVWAPLLDSPLLMAQLTYLRALVACEQSHTKEAEYHARQARRQFEVLGLSYRCAEALIVLVRARQLASAAADEISELETQLDALLQSFANGFTERDRKLYLLNKWQHVDRLVARDLKTLSGTVNTARQRREFLSGLTDLEQRRSGNPLSAQAHRDPLLEASITMLRGDIAVLMFFVLPDRISLALLWRGGTRLFDSPSGLSKAGLHELFGEALDALHYADTWDDLYEQRNQALQRLNRGLALEEALELLPSSVTHLAIIPDDALWNLPFSALPYRGRPMIERFSLSFLPALRFSLRPAQRLRSRSALGVAVSEVDPGFRSLSPLPHALADLTSIRLSRPRSLRELTGTEATVANVKSSLADCDLVHLACHGEYQPESPLKSGLILHHELLSLEEMHQLSAPQLHLAVVGACWAGSSAVLPGHDAVSVPMMLIQRGARAVVAALWEVNDQLTSTLFDSFYRDLPATGPQNALAVAQRGLLALDGGESHVRLCAPRHWAPYVLIENGLSVRTGFGWWMRFRRYLFERSPPRVRDR